MILSSIVRRCGLETAWRKNRVRTNDPDSYRNCYYIDTIIFRCRRKRICLGNFFSTSERCCTLLFSWENALIVSEPQRTSIKITSKSDFLISTHLSPFRKRHRISGLDCPVTPKEMRKTTPGNQRLTWSYLDFNLRSGTRSAPESSSLGHCIFFSFFFVFFFSFYKRVARIPPKCKNCVRVCVHMC